MYPLLAIVQISAANGQQCLFQIGTYLPAIPDALYMPARQGTVGAVILGRDVHTRSFLDDAWSGKADIGRTHLSAIERGERKPTLETFFRICEAMNIKPSVVMAAIENEVYKKQDI